MFRNFKVLLIVFVAIVVAGSAYAFAAANTIAVSGAGYKDSVVSGYAVTNVIYDLDTDPTKLEKIIFDIAPIAPNTAAAVVVKISTAAIQDFTTSTCVISGTTTIIATCTFTSAIDVADVVALDVVASSSSNP
jgi:hypothetical protein